MIRKKLEVVHKGHRYWATRHGRITQFWSSHKWPFYHGHFQSSDEDEIRRAFFAWLPFDYMKAVK